jgi:tetratricopeptide (TPR) repeat protein
MIGAGIAGAVAVLLNHSGPFNTINIRFLGACGIFIFFGGYLIWIDFLASAWSNWRWRRRVPDFREQFSKGQINMVAAALLGNDKIKPWDNQSLGVRALVYRLKGRFDDAIVDYNEIIRLDPKSSDFVARGVTYLQKGEIDKALIDFNRAIEVDQRAAAAYFHRGNVMRSKGNLRQALGDYTKVIEVNPTFVSAFVARGQLYADQGDRQLAIADLGSAIERDPKNVTAYCLRGSIYADIGEFERALDDIKSATTLDPKSTDLPWTRKLISTQRRR